MMLLSSFKCTQMNRKHFSAVSKCCIVLFIQVPLEETGIFEVVNGSAGVLNVSYVSCVELNILCVNISV